MKNLGYFAVGILGAVMLAAPLAFADTTSISIQSILPGTSVLANSKITFSIVAFGFFPQSYQLSDSFNGSSIALSDISPSGNLFWVPLPSDVGTHTLTITALDEAGDSASVTQTVVVLPPPSVSIQSVSPGPIVMPGKAFSFSVSTTGFTNPSYTVGDEFSGSSVTDADISVSGNFSWTPDMSQDGQHTISIYAYDSLGHNATANQAVQVGAGPTLLAQVTSSSTVVYPGQVVSIIVSGNNFAPTTFSVSDSFPLTTIVSGYITTSGSFTWTPQSSDIGTHVLTFTGIIGNYGQSATTSKTITVLSPNGYVPPASVTLQVPSAVAPAAANTGAPVFGFLFTTSLYSGMRGNGVTELQTVLSQQGFFTGTPNGYFGPLTLAAVEQFQAAHGLPQLGVVGPATRAVLNSLLAGSPAVSGTVASSTAVDGYTFQNPTSFGQSGTDVLELQKRLAALGFFSGQPTGYFGNATLQAVIQFQETKGIPPVDQLGPATRAALNQ